MKTFSTYFDAKNGILVGRELTQTLIDKGFEKIQRRDFYPATIETYFYEMSGFFYPDNGASFNRIRKSISGGNKT